MITINTLWIILAISLILIVTGFYFKKKALFLILCGGVILLITGLITFSDPISFPTIKEKYNYDNLTLDNITQELNPTPINNNLNYLLSWIMILLGLSCIIGASIKLYDSKFDEEETGFELTLKE